MTIANHALHRAWVFVEPKSAESYSALYCCNEIMFVRACNASSLETGYLCHGDSMLAGMLMSGSSKFLNRLSPVLKVLKTQSPKIAFVGLTEKTSLMPNAESRGDT